MINRLNNQIDSSSVQSIKKQRGGCEVYVFHDDDICYGLQNYHIHKGQPEGGSGHLNESNIEKLVTDLVDAAKSDREDLLMNEDRIMKSNTLLAKVQTHQDPMEYQINWSQENC